MYYLILYKDTPEGKIEDYKISIEKRVSTGSEKWLDIGGKRIFNMEMFKKFILTDPEVQNNINQYWKANRIDWKPKFKIGDYVEPKKNYGWTVFKDKNGRGELETSWFNIVCMVVGETENRLLIQVVRMSSSLLNSSNTYSQESKNKINNALHSHWELQKLVNPYNFKKID